MGAGQKRGKKRTIAARDGWCCHYCRRRLTIDSATLDHVIPRAKGGTWNNTNLVLACRDCNKRKADMLPHVFVGLVMQGLAA